MTSAAPWDDYAYRVASNVLVTPVIRQLWLAPEEDALPFRPGQYALLSDRAFRVPQRSYSMANAPRPDGRVSMLVTLVPGGPTSSWVHARLQPDDDVLLSGPYGTFVLDEPAAPVLLLGAGSGLAPVRALAEALLAERSSRTVTLIFSARTAADAIDHDLFTAWARDRARFRYLRTLTRDSSAEWHERVPAILPRMYGSLRGNQVFAAGPPGFVTACAAVACELGAAPDAVHTEEFFADPQPWTAQPAVDGRDPGR